MTEEEAPGGQHCHKSGKSLLIQFSTISQKTPLTTCQPFVPMEWKSQNWLCNISYMKNGPTVFFMIVLKAG